MADVLNIETDDSLLLEDGSNMLVLEYLGWTGKICGVTNPSKICGVPVCDIEEV